MVENLRCHRRALHKIPEIGFDLPQTRAYILDALSQTDAQISSAAQSGVLAFFDAGKAQTVAFRSDMDALPVTESTDVPFASEHPGRMHACGHDGHMAVLLTFSLWVQEHLSELPNNVLLIFQPAEESGGGANKIVESGALEQYRVKRIFATHVEPSLPLGTLACRPGAFMAQSSEVHIRVQGKAAHAARWREGIDAAYAGALLIVELSRMERSLPEDMPRLLKFGKLHAGTAVNVIAEEAQLGGTMRAFSVEDFHFLRDRVLSVAAECEAATGARISVEFSESYPPLRNDPALYEMFLRATEGMDVRRCEPNLLSEDFSYYLQFVPGLMFQTGLGTGTELHSPQFHMDERALLSAYEAFCRLARLA